MAAALARAFPWGVRRGGWAVRRTLSSRDSGRVDLDSEDDLPAPAVPKVVFTGGPCGGKSTALVRIGARLQSYGIKVFTVPEAATMLITGGLSFEGSTRDQVVSAQVHLMRTMLALEDAMTGIAADYQNSAAGRKAVVLCDRGALDAKAYVTPEMWAEILAHGTEGGWDEDLLRDSRYDGVVHLVTAAIGAESHYTLANNAARTEGLEEAAAVRRVCWGRGSRGRGRGGRVGRVLCCCRV